MKKFERKTKEERRRVLLSKNYESSYSLDNEKLQQNGAATSGVLAKTMELNRRVIAAVLALLFAISCMVIGIHFSAKADSNLPAITFDNENKYTIPADGSLPAGTYRYIGPDGNEYAFTTTVDLVPNDTLTLDFDNKKVSVQHDYTYGAVDITGNYKHELPYGETWISEDEWKEDYYEGPLTTVDSSDLYKLNINSEAKQHLDSSKTYYYKDPYNSDIYYLIQVDNNFGHVMTEGRTGFEEESGLFNNASITINLDEDGNPLEPIFEGNYFKRHCYYIESNSLTANKVYLVFGETQEKETSLSGSYLLEYTNSHSFDVNYYDRYALSYGNGNCTNGHGQEVYTFSAKKVNENEDYFRFNGGDGITNNLYDKDLHQISFSDSASSIYHYNNRYFYGEDGSIQLDPYVYCELKKKKKGKTHFWNWWKSQYALMAYDGEEGSSSYGYYTDSKVLGSAYGNDMGKILAIHPTCKGESSILKLDHNYGDLWSYNASNYDLSNNNAIDTKHLSFKDGTFGLRPYNWAINVDESYHKHSKIYLFEMVFVFSPEDYDVSGSVIKVSNAPTDVDLVELRKANITLDSSVAGNNTFDVTVELINSEDPTSPVNGTYGELTFVDGVATKTAMTNGDTINLRSIPSTFSIKVTPTPTDSSLAGDYDFSYLGTDQEDGSNTNTASLEEANRNITITVFETAKDAHFKLEYDQNDPSKQFPVTFRLKDKDGTLVSQTFGEGETAITFENGVYSTLMKNNDSIDISKLPFNSTITVDVAAPSGEATDYYSFVISNDTDTSTPASADYTINAEKNEKITVSNQRAPITVVNHTTGTYANTSRAFPISLLLKKADGSVADTISLETADGQTVNFENGIYNTELSHDQSITIILPKGYTLIASDEEEHPYYTTTIKVDGEEGNTAVAGTNTSIEIIRNRADAVDTGITNDSDTSSAMLYVLACMAVVSGSASVAYVYRKKVTE